MDAAQQATQAARHAAEELEQRALKHVGAGPSFTAELLGGLGVLAAIVLIGYGIKTRPVPALLSCRAPSELEQLHIVVERRGDRLISSCMYLTAPGGKRRP